MVPKRLQNLQKLRQGYGKGEGDRKEEEVHLILATSNRGKYAEYREILSRSGIKLELVLIKYPEEQLDSLEEVAKKSAYYVREIIKGDFFLDDSGIFINELKGFPGVYSSYVNKTIGNPGILKLMENARDRSAQFSTCIAYYDGTVNLFVGKTSGTISTTERGRNGFGFDPIFIPDGYEETYAEMPLEKKNSLSHRFKAANLFLEFLKKKKI